MFTIFIHICRDAQLSLGQQQEFAWICELKEEEEGDDDEYHPNLGAWVPKINGCKITI